MFDKSVTNIYGLNYPSVGCTLEKWVFLVSLGDFYFYQNE